MTLFEIYDRVMRAPLRREIKRQARERHEPTWFYIDPCAIEKLKLKDTPAAAMTDTD